MRRRRRKTGKPTGGGGARHPNSLSNLIPGGPSGAAAGPGNLRALSHGAESALLVRDVSDEIAELRDALAEAAPVQEDGSPPAADAVALESAARALKRYRHVSNWCDLHGRLDADGEVRSAATYELATERELLGLLDALGMTPQSRSKLGLRLVQATAAAEDARADREARERLDRRFAGLDALAPPAGGDDTQDQRDAERNTDPGPEIVADGKPDDPDGDPDHADEDQDAPRSLGHGRSVSAERRER